MHTPLSAILVTSALAVAGGAVFVSRHRQALAPPLNDPASMAVAPKAAATPRTEVPIATRTPGAPASVVLPLAASVADTAITPATQVPDSAQPSLEVPKRQASGEHEALESLRVRVAAAEETIANNQKLAEQLKSLGDEVRAIRAELAAERAADAAARAQRQQRTAERSAALAGLVGSAQKLATGDTGGVDEALEVAANVLGTTARAEVEAARAALANEDLVGTRTYILEALADASQ